MGVFEWLCCHPGSLWVSCPVLNELLLVWPLSQHIPMVSRWSGNTAHWLLHRTRKFLTMCGHIPVALLLSMGVVVVVWWCLLSRFTILSFYYCVPVASAYIVWFHGSSGCWVMSCICIRGPGILYRVYWCLYTYVCMLAMSRENGGCNHCNKNIIVCCLVSTKGSPSCCPPS